MKVSEPNLHFWRRLEFILMTHTMHKTPFFGYPHDTHQAEHVEMCLFVYLGISLYPDHINNVSSTYFCGMFQSQLCHELFSVESKRPVISRWLEFTLKSYLNHLT